MAKRKTAPRIKMMDEAEFAAEQIVRSKILNTPQAKAQIKKVAKAIRQAAKDPVKAKPAKPAPKRKGK